MIELNKIGCLFPGQGAQHVGMGAQMAQSFVSARETFQAADHILGMDLSRLMFDGPEKELTLTRNCQPALYACSIACYRTCLR